MSSEPATQYYHHGRFKFEGGTLPDAFTAYRTYGNSANPCIAFPTCYGGKLDSKWSLYIPDMESTIEAIYRISRSGVSYWIGQGMHYL